MMRVCHLDTCPVGVATQNPELRKRFTGKPEFVVNFFEFIAREVREYLAALGFRTLDEAVGRTDRLDAVRAVSHWKAAGLDLSRVLHVPDLPPDAARHNTTGSSGPSTTRSSSWPRVRCRTAPPLCLSCRSATSTGRSAPCSDTR
jgi:glutamate synthase (NADPH/NADH) large chain